jgi:hypothetical protein
MERKSQCYSVASDAAYILSMDFFERQMDALAGRFKTARLRDPPETMASISPGTMLACVMFNDG